MPKIIENLPEKLAEEARRQVAEAGYAAMTIRSVAKGCGVGIGTVYNYYASKDALAAAFMLTDWKNALQAIEEAAGAARTPDAALEAIHTQVSSFCRLHQGIFRDDAATAAFAGSFSRYHALLRSQLAAPIRRFCREDFQAEFITEALLTWTVAGKSFGQIHPLLKKLFE